MNIIAKNQTETQNIGQKIAAILCGGDIVCLHGDLGTGKTTLTQGLAQGLGISETITSPTFSLMNVYSTPKFALVHLDTYRLESEQDLIDIGIEDYLGDPSAVCIVEWPEKMAELFKNKKTLDIHIKHLADGGREISLPDNIV